MSKKLPTNDIANELAGSSVFFQPSTPSKVAPKLPEADDDLNPATQTAEMTSPSNRPSNQDMLVSRLRDTTVTNHQGRKQPLNQDNLISTHLGEIRKAVKQLGKEAATHRFSAEEKAALADIVYTYARQGLRTSENEITRIGVNWMLLDYQQNGANSILARLLEQLHG